MDHQSTISKPSLLGMIWSPSEQFDRIRENPRIWGALIIVTVLSVVGALIGAFSIPDDLYLEMGIPAEQVEAVKLTGQIGGAVGGLLLPAFAILIGSAIQLLITTLARTEASFKQLFSMNTYIYIITAISGLLNSLVFLVAGGDPNVMVTSLGSLIEAEGAMAGLLSSIEVFTIWSTVLTAIGLHKVGRLSKGAAWTVAIVFFVVGMIMAALSMAFSGMAGV